MIAEVSGEFEKDHPDVAVSLSFGPSNTLAMQVLAGASADIFISANSRWSDHLQKNMPGVTLAPLLKNKLVLVVPQGNPANVGSLDDLMEPNVESVALAGENVPLGMYGTQALRTHGSHDALCLAGKIVRASDARATLAYVVRGEVDAGIVYATDALNEPRVTEVAELNSNDYDPVVYSAVLLQNGNSLRANSFLVFLRSAKAKEIFIRHGFVWNTNSQLSQ